MLAKLRTVLKDGVQTGGNSSALTDAAAAALVATGVRCTLTVAHQLQALGARWGVASACVGGGQGIALLVENPAA